MARLAAFNAEHGHCRVPTNPGAHEPDPKVGRWVGNQRQYKKRLDVEKPNPRITAERVARLEAIGLEWVVGKGKQ